MTLMARSKPAGPNTRLNVPASEALLDTVTCPAGSAGLDLEAEGGGAEHDKPNDHAPLAEIRPAAHVSGQKDQPSSSDSQANLKVVTDARMGHELIDEAPQSQQLQHEPGSDLQQAQTTTTAESQERGSKLDCLQVSEHLSGWCLCIRSFPNIDDPDATVSTQLLQGVLDCIEHLDPCEIHGRQSLDIMLYAFPIAVAIL